MQRFLGNDWRSSNEKAAEDFSRAATISLVQGLTKAKIGTTEPAAEFAHGGLIQSLNQAKAYSLSNGLPRLIVYSDLAAYGLPVADTATARAKGRSDAETIAIDLQRVEVDLFTPGKATSEAATEYLKSFFLAAKGKVETIAGEGGVPCQQWRACEDRGLPGRHLLWLRPISYPDARRTRSERLGDHVLDRGAVRPAPVFALFRYSQLYRRGHVHLRRRPGFRADLERQARPHPDMRRLDAFRRPARPVFLHARRSIDGKNCGRDLCHQWSAGWHKLPVAAGSECGVLGIAPFLQSHWPHSLKAVRLLLRPELAPLNCQKGFRAPSRLGKRWVSSIPTAWTG